MTYIFGPKQADLLCLAVDYCSQKYPFVCEMNAASIKLATQSNHGTVFVFIGYNVSKFFCSGSDGNPSGGSGAGNGNQVDFEQPPPPPPSELNFGNPFEQDPSAVFSLDLLLVLHKILSICLVNSKEKFILDNESANFWHCWSSAYRRSRRWIRRHAKEKERRTCWRWWSWWRNSGSTEFRKFNWKCYGRVNL